MLIHQGKPNGLTWVELIYSLADKEFQCLTRSTLSVLCYWKEAGKRIEEVLEQLGFESSAEADLSFEYTVPSFGSNRPSFTDVMYLSEKACIGFEGKYTEPRYDTVETWLGEKPSVNKRNVLGHWLDMIQPFSLVHLEPEHFSRVVYQMLHRLASACFQRDPTSGQSAMVYQVFVDEGEPHVDYAADMQDLYEVVRPNRSLRLALQIIEQSQTDALEELRLRFPSGAADASRVRRALLGNSFFKFTPRPIKIIG